MKGPDTCEKISEEEKYGRTGHWTEPTVISWGRRHWKASQWFFPISFPDVPQIEQVLRGLWGESPKHLLVTLHHTISQLHEEETHCGASWSQHTFWSQEQGNLLLGRQKQSHTKTLAKIMNVLKSWSKEIRMSWALRTRGNHFPRSLTWASNHPLRTMGLPSLQLGRALKGQGGGLLEDQHSFYKSVPSFSLSF